jgi:hypothetical protein
MKKLIEILPRDNSLSRNGLGEINRDLLDEDFWPETIRRRSRGTLNPC